MAENSMVYKEQLYPPLLLSISLMHCVIFQRHPRPPTGIHFGQNDRMRR